MTRAYRGHATPVATYVDAGGYYSYVFSAWCKLANYTAV